MRCVKVMAYLSCLNDDDLYTRARELVVLYVGVSSDGGMAGRDMEAMAQGIYEAVDDDYI